MHVAQVVLQSTDGFFIVFENDSKGVWKDTVENIRQNFDIYQN